MITAMFMATSVWSAEYMYCKSPTGGTNYQLLELRKCIIKWMDEGYVLHGQTFEVSPNGRQAVLVQGLVKQ